MIIWCRVENPSVAEAFIDPDADFSVFNRVAVLEPHVAFRTNWQRDQNRSRAGRVTVRDMERIKSDVATLFARVFTDRLESAGYEVVEVAADDVLVVRPAIIDLDITAPDYAHSRGAVAASPRPPAQPHSTSSCSIQCPERFWVAR